MKQIFLPAPYLFIISIALYTKCGALIKENINQTVEFEISPTEDLMREHGALNRLLLIYEHIIHKIDNAEDFSIPLLSKTIDIIKSFIEEYHEKLEENYIFSLFEQQKKELSLIKTLKKQHIKGREITAQLQAIIKTPITQRRKTSIKKLLQQFVTMYRPHEAREDTILFPLVRSLISLEEFNKLGEKFEELENTLFGNHGFETIVQKIETIEKELGIYRLEQFTPSMKESDEKMDK